MPFYANAHAKNLHAFYMSDYIRNAAMYIKHLSLILARSIFSFELSISEMFNPYTQPLLNRPPD